MISAGGKLNNDCVCNIACYQHGQSTCGGWWPGPAPNTCHGLGSASIYTLLSAASALYKL